MNPPSNAKPQQPSGYLTRKGINKLAALGLVIASCLPLRADVPLVADGKPVAEIVLSPGASPSVKTAANELQCHLEAMSGAKLPIVGAASANVKSQVYVGESDATRKLGVSLDDVKDDGYKIVAEKNHVVIAGRQTYHFAASFQKFKDVTRSDRQKAWENLIGHKWRFPPMIDFRDYSDEFGFHAGDGTGTLYAVYDLLEQLGMRWYLPMADIGIVTPNLKTITIKDQSTKKEPEFPVRIFADCKAGNSRDEFLWYKSMRVGSAICLPVYHSVSGPTKLYPDEQPQEYYGKVGGKTDYSVPKLSNERLRADTVEYLGWVDKAFPGIGYEGVGQPDGWSRMDADDAAAGWDKISERGPNGRFSDYAWDFSMDIRKRIMEKNPEKKFTIFAYSCTRRPPSNLEKVPDNVTVVFCQTSAFWMLPNKELEDRKEWLAKMSNKNQLLIWEYYLQHAPNYNFPPVPVIFPKFMQENFKGLYDHSAGFLVEVGWSAAVADLKANKPNLARPWITHLMLYLHSKLCWDRNLDVRAVMEEYYDLFYGPAKAEMKEFYEFAESVWSRPEARQITAAGGFLKPDDVDRYFEILARAKAKAGDTVYGKRVDFIAAEMAPLKLAFEKLKRLGPNLQIKASKDQPTIDGDLDKPFWRDIPYTFLPLKDMKTGNPSKQAGTSVSFRWLNDNSALIIGIECKEPKMESLVASCKDADSPGIYADDMVQVNLETAKGIRPMIVVNSAGTVLDECITEKLADLASFYKIDKVAVKKYADRWTVELKVDAKPISGERPTPFYPWGANICRQRMAGGTPELSMLSPSKTNFKDLKYMANIFVRK
jgi:hypothetical protein